VGYFRFWSIACRGHHVERPRANPRNLHVRHGFRDRLDVHREASGAQIRGEPSRALEVPVMHRVLDLQIQLHLLPGG